MAEQVRQEEETVSTAFYFYFFYFLHFICIAHKFINMSEALGGD